MIQLGRFFQKQQKHARLWLAVVLLVLAGLAAASVFFTAPEPHFYLDAYPCFWPLFGLIVGLVMIVVMKKLVQPLIERKEDFYGDG